MSEPREWLLIAISTAGAPASLRVTVWRKLKALGALYIQQSTCLIPATPKTTRGIRTLAAKVQDEGGSARVLSFRFTDPAEETEVVAELQAARADEYQELLTRIQGFFAELDEELEQGRATYEEVEESEADLARYQAWFEKIVARDYDPPAEQESARAELERAEQALDDFTKVAMKGLHEE
ncbi:Chromate resistance protein ChrB [Corynebacterium lubricantis]|uniref:Chromate resistance protein ChrB n=1 Tax=Corynebacterium lubricantis TaxID=541095 RepID=UPI00037795CB|nr:Chromate resistance protein ChrB [Corynebacterium lubricantis]